MAEDYDYIHNWLIKADNDLKISCHEIENADPVTDMICFHCQQAVEKYFKAFIISKGIEVERTHNIYYLQTKCSEIDTSFNGIDLKDLNYFGVMIRYPDDFYIPTFEEAKEYIEIATKVGLLIKTKISIR